jgi:hypothetical protein
MDVAHWPVFCIVGLGAVYVINRAFGMANARTYERRRRPWMLVLIVVGYVVFVAVVVLIARR